MKHSWSIFCFPLSSGFQQSISQNDLLAGANLASAASKFVQTENENSDLAVVLQGCPLSGMANKLCPGWKSLTSHDKKQARGSCTTSNHSPWVELMQCRFLLFSVLCKLGLEELRDDFSRPRTPSASLFINNNSREDILRVRTRDSVGLKASNVSGMLIYHQNLRCIFHMMCNNRF